MQKTARLFTLLLLGSVFPLFAQNLVVTNATNITMSESYSSVFIGATNEATPSGQLTVGSGAVLTGTNLLALGYATAGNSLTIDGAGSQVSFVTATNSFGIIGAGGGTASLLVTNGGLLRIRNTALGGPATYILAMGTTEAASGNSLVVAGVGSSVVLSNFSGHDLRVGDSSAGNQLIVKEGGSVIMGSGNDITVGNTATASNNVVLITGSGSAVTNQNFTLGRLSTGNSLTVADGGRLVATNLVNNGLMISGTNGVSNSALVTGSGSQAILNAVSVGDSGIGQLVVSNGGSFSSTSLQIGSQAGSDGSSMLVTGTNSVVTASSSGLTVGNFSGGNTATVRDGAVLNISNSSTSVGGRTNSHGNSVTVDNATLVGGQFTVGTLGRSNSLVVTNGGQVSLVGGSSQISVGSSFTNTASGNSVLVTGSNSSVIAANAVIGGRSASNSLTVENGAFVGLTNLSALFTVGDSNSSAANSLVVTGPGSTFSNRSYAGAIGRDGSGNSLLVSNGATFISMSNLTVGSQSPASNNSAVVTGSGSLLSVAGTFAIGQSGANNRLVVSNEARVSGNNFNIGSFNHNNSALVTGSGTVLSNAGLTRVGGSVGTTTNNSLTVAENAVFHSGSLTIGTSNTASTYGSVWIGQDRPSVRSMNVLHTNAASNSVVTVNGRFQAATNVSVGGRGIVLGRGTIAAPTVSILNGGTIAPGASPGTLTIDGDLAWQSGGNYNWELYNATGVAGATNSWDLLSVSGALDLTGLSVGNEFKINLWTLSVLPQTNGSAINFTNTNSYTWRILTATGGISGFSADKFIINTGATNGTGGFANALAAGWGFSLTQTGGDLNLVYAQQSGPEPVPEPGTWAAAALLVGGAAYVRWRRRTKVS